MTHFERESIAEGDLHWDKEPPFSLSINGEKGEKERATVCLKGQRGFFAFSWGERRISRGKIIGGDDVLGKYHQKGWPESW